MSTSSRQSATELPPEADGASMEESVRTIAPEDGRVKFETAAGADVARTEIPLQEPACAGEVMTEQVATAGADDDLVRVAAIMRDHNVGIVPIVDADSKILGVITDRDIVIRVDANAASPAEVKAGDVMTARPVTVRPEDDLHDVIDRMGDEGLQRVLVVDDQARLVGIISVSDLAQRTDLPERVQDTLDQIVRHRA